MTIQVYIEYNVITRDLSLDGMLCKALNSFKNLSESIKLTVLSSNGLETDDVKDAFNHQVVLGDFATIKTIPEITKDITYISSNYDDLKEWDELRGKAILASEHQVESFDGLNKFYVKDSEDEILRRLRMYIHI